MVIAKKTVELLSIEVIELLRDRDLSLTISWQDKRTLRLQLESHKNLWLCERKLDVQMLLSGYYPADILQVYIEEMQEKMHMNELRLAGILNNSRSDRGKDT